jgi:hypothetical protein
MVSSLLATIAKPAIAAAVQKLVSSQQGTFSEAKVMAKLRMMWSELYRLRRVHKHCYEYAQLAVLARLCTWAAAQWQTNFDVSTLYCDRPDPALSKVLAAFKGPLNPITTLQTTTKEYKEFKSLVTPVLESVKSLKAKNLPDALKVVNEKLKKLESANEELKGALRRKVDRDGGGGGKGGDGGKGGVAARAGATATARRNRRAALRLLLLLPKRSRTRSSSSGVGAYMGCTLQRRPHPHRTMLRLLVLRRPALARVRVRTRSQY